MRHILASTCFFSVFFFFFCTLRRTCAVKRCEGARGESPLRALFSSLGRSWAFRLEANASPFRPGLWALPSGLHTAWVGMRNVDSCATRMKVNQQIFIFFYPFPRSELGLVTAAATTNILTIAFRQ